MPDFNTSDLWTVPANLDVADLDRAIHSKYVNDDLTFGICPCGNCLDDDLFYYTPTVPNGRDVADTSTDDASVPIKNRCVYVDDRFLTSVQRAGLRALGMDLYVFAATVFDGAASPVLRQIGQDAKRAGLGTIVVWSSGPITQQRCRELSVRLVPPVVSIYSLVGVGY